MIPVVGHVWRQKRTGKLIVVLNDTYEDVFVQWRYLDGPPGDWHYSDCHGFVFGDEHEFVRDHV